MLRDCRNSDIGLFCQKKLYFREKGKRGKRLIKYFVNYCIHKPKKKNITG